jgi:hypothetical protein
MYTYPEVRNVPFLDVAGNPAGELVLLGEVEVSDPGSRSLDGSGSP